MEFRDLKAQYQHHKDAIDEAMIRVAAGGTFIGGSPVAELEQALASYVGAKYCISCANGTDALQLALMAWGIGSGDAVFVPDFTFFSSGEVVPLVGATPVFVDVCEDTFNMDPESLENAIRHVSDQTDLKPRVIVAVDLFGLPADHHKIREIADRYDLLVLEDGAQGFGGKIGDPSGSFSRACSFGDISTTSFFPAKPLGCYGDGGAVFTDNGEWADLLRSLKVHGKGSDKYDNIRIGLNSRLDTIQAAILLEKLKFFDEELVRCDEAAKTYDALFTDLSSSDLRIPVIPEDYTSAWAQYTVLFKDETLRTRVMECLKAEGIPSMIYYKKPMHLQKAFEGYEEIQPRTGSGDICPVTTEICGRCLSLPMSAYVTKEEITTVVRTIEKALTT